MTNITIGVLALQGAFIEHIHTLNKISDIDPSLNITTIEIRNLNDLTNNDFDGLMIPGGESTTIGLLLKELKLEQPLLKLIRTGIPVFGTCAGLILLAKNVENESTHLGVINLTAKRNAYGRQLGSFKYVDNVGDIEDYPMVFIRAPYISQLGEGVSVLATVDDKIVAAKQDNILVTAFHPELTDDLRLHQSFVNSVVQNSDSIKECN